MSKLIPCRLDNGTLYGYGFYCPACRELHHFNVAVFQPIWSFDGNLESPTFGPSLRIIGGNGCHLFVLGGQIQYCPDSRHELAGKTVPMVSIERWQAMHTINGKPVAEVDREIAAAEAELKERSKAAIAAQHAPHSAVPQVHREECGIVGNVGAVGDLGSNAKG